MLRVVDLRATPAAIAEARAFVREASWGLSDQDRMDLLLAAGEATTNAVRHGSPRGERCRILLICRRTEEWLTVTIHDSGVPFEPPASLPSPDEPGGRGVHVMRCCVDEVAFGRWEMGNVVTLRKRLGDGATGK